MEICKAPTLWLKSLEHKHNVHKHSILKSLEHKHSVHKHSILKRGLWRTDSLGILFVSWNVKTWCLEAQFARVWTWCTEVYGISKVTTDRAARWRFELWKWHLNTLLTPFCRNTLFSLVVSVTRSGFEIPRPFVVSTKTWFCAENWSNEKIKLHLILIWKLTVGIHKHTWQISPDRLYSELCKRFTD